MRRLTVLLGILAALSAVPAAMAEPVTTTHNSAFGRILFDTRGFALYAFSADTAGKSTCHGACLKAWPPYVRGGRQVVYKGHPLYYYIGDRKAGQILCQNVSEFGGLWQVVRPSGATVA